MRTFLALVWREIAERRLLLAASAVLGLVPVVLPLLPWRPERHSPEELRTAALAVLVLLFGGATLLMLGATIVGRDLSEGRLSFYFSRPVSGWALWCSRLAAACALVLASVVLLAAPTAAVDLGSWIEDLGDRPDVRVWPLLAAGEVFYFPGWTPEALPASPPALIKLAYGVGAILLLLALAHAVSTIVRGRSLWLLADLAGLAAVIAIGWAARDVLVLEQALGALAWAERLLVPWILAALVLAGGLQLARGRTDPRRGHLFLSATLWSALIAGALSFGAYARWVAASGVDDLETLAFADASASEDWLLAGGPTRGRAGAAAAFLLDVRSGNAWRLGNLAVVRAWHAFSADGGTLAWARCESFRPPACRLWVKDLRERRSAPRSTGIPLEGNDTRLAASEDGSRFAVVARRRIAVYELPSARLLTAVEADHPEDAYFVSRDLVRYHEAIETEDGWRTRVRQIDLAGRRSVTTGWQPRGSLVSRSPIGDAVLYQRLFPPGFGLYDGVTGEPRFTLDERRKRFPSRGGFLADGRVVLCTHEARRVTLLVLSPEGEEDLRVEQAAATGCRLGGEIAPGRALVALREPETASGDAAAPEAEPRSWLEALQRRQRSPRPPGGWTTYELDVATGELSPRVVGALPLFAPTGMPGRRLLWTSEGDVVEWRPATDEGRTLLPAPER